jgi:hypothetical protein
MMGLSIFQLSGHRTAGFIGAQNVIKKGPSKARPFQKYSFFFRAFMADWDAFFPIA